MDMDTHQIKRHILEVVEEQSHAGSIQTVSVLEPALKRSGLQRTRDNQQAFLTIWHDLFRTGSLAWGLDFANSSPPFCHVTDQGRRSLRNLSRDPANPDGYLAHLATLGTLNQAAQSYLNEALKTYNADCYKASAVMIGGATESMILELRDLLVERKQDLGQPAHKDLQNWQIKRVLDAINDELRTHRREMPVGLAEAVEQYWPAFTGQIRTSRNDAGHPASIEPVTHENVHASLLIFPELAKLAFTLGEWILKNYY